MDIIKQIKKKLNERPIDRVEITSLLLLFEPDTVVSAAVETRKRSLVANNPSGAINALGAYLLSSLSSKKIKGFEKIRPLLRVLYSPSPDTKRKAVKKRSKTPRPNKPTQRNPRL